MVWGVPFRRGFHLPGGGQKIGKKGFSRRRSRREKFLSTFFEIWKLLSTFFEIFGKFANKNTTKSDFWCGVGRFISKISKKYPLVPPGAMAPLIHLWSGPIYSEKSIYLVKEIAKNSKACIFTFARGKGSKGLVRFRN